MTHDRQSGWSICAVTSVLLGSPVMSPQPPPRSSIPCCSPQVSCVSGTPGQISDDEVPIPRLHVTFPLTLLTVLLLPRLPTVMMKFPFCIFHTVLLWFRVMVKLRFLSRTPVLLPSYCSPSTYPAGWRPWPMPSRVWLVLICFSFLVQHLIREFHAMCWQTTTCLYSALLTRKLHH
jgi:hypothetical protein